MVCMKRAGGGEGGGGGGDRRDGGFDLKRGKEEDGRKSWCFYSRRIVMRRERGGSTRSHCGGSGTKLRAL